MNSIRTLLADHPVIALHLAAALFALAVGTVVMLRPKGTVSHKTLGWTWVVLMVVVAVSSAFIRDFRLPNIAGYTPIHFFTAWVLAVLPWGIVRIRRGQVAGHRAIMRSLFYGACVIAGAFTLMPGRFLGDLLWRQTLHVVG